MTKRPDFATDMEDVKLDVSENVLDILTAAKERAAKRNLSEKTSERAIVEMPRNHDSDPKTKQRTHTVRKPVTRPQPNEAPVWKDVATKLTIETKERLRRTALLQRANGLKPDTEYGILNEAAEDWFKRHGYARRLKVHDASQDEADERPEDDASDAPERP